MAKAFDIPMRRLYGKDEIERRHLALILRNMADAVEHDTENGNGELIVQATVNAGQAWQGDPDSFTVFEAQVSFSAGPNSVITTPRPADWEPIKNYNF